MSIFPSHARNRNLEIASTQAGSKVFGFPEMLARRFVKSLIVNILYDAEAQVKKQNTHKEEHNAKNPRLAKIINHCDATPVRLSSAAGRIKWNRVNNLSHSDEKEANTSEE
jgi:hypothetical protein